MSFCVLRTLSYTSTILPKKCFAPILFNRNVIDISREKHSKASTQYFQKRNKWSLFGKKNKNKSKETKGKNVCKNEKVKCCDDECICRCKIDKCCEDECVKLCRRIIREERNCCPPPECCEKCKCCALKVEEEKKCCGPCPCPCPPPCPCPCPPPCPSPCPCSCPCPCPCPCPCELCPCERKCFDSKTCLEASTGMKMPLLILDTWKFEKLEETVNTLIQAFKVGYRAINISPESEEVVGCVLQCALECCKLTRNDIFLISKLPFDSMKCVCVKDQLESTLRKLRTDYIDLFMIAFPAGSVKMGDCTYKPDTCVDHLCLWKAMECTVDSCKAKYIGLCNFNCLQLDAIVDMCRIKPSNLQIELHPYFQQRNIRKVAKELCIPVTAYAPWGITKALREYLEGRGYKDCKPNPVDDPTVHCIAQQLCTSPQNIILRFLLQMDDRLAVVSGPSNNPYEVCKNFDIFDFTLDRTAMARLKDLDRGSQMRLFNRALYKVFFPGVDCHPMFPWKDCCCCNT